METKTNKQTLVICLICFLLIPITLIFGSVVLHDSRYYLVSSLVIIHTMIPFILLFESRKPEAKEIVLIAVICALAVAGRSAFYMLPHFKPVVAMIIIAGACLGYQSGFMIGAITAFISNIFFGQGPWTPFQMLALGSIGAIAGILFATGRIKTSKRNLCIYGFFATFFIYGLIMDAHFTLTATGTLTLPAYLAAMASGFFPNLLHSAASIFFLLLFSQPMIEQINRVNIKYGLIFSKSRR